MAKRPCPWVFSIAVLVLFGIEGPSFAQDVTIVDQAELLLTAISYDQKLEERYSEGLRMGFLYSGNSEKVSAVSDAFAEKGKSILKDLPVVTFHIRFTTVSNLLKNVDEKRINAVYIDSSAGFALSSIQQVTRARKILSLTGTKRLVHQGASIGVYLEGDTPKLLINLKSLRVEGIKLKAKILGISRVIK